MERLNKEYKMNINDNFDIKYGSIDRNNPQVLYVCGKTWVCPLIDLDYKSVVENIEYNFRKNIKKLVRQNTNLTNKFVCNFELNHISLTKDKKNYMYFEIYLKQNSHDIKMLKNIGSDIKTDLKILIEKLNEELYNYNFSLTKSK